MKEQEGLGKGSALKSQPSTVCDLAAQGLQGERIEQLFLLWLPGHNARREDSKKHSLTKSVSRRLGSRSNVLRPFSDVSSASPHPFPSLLSVDRGKTISMDLSQGKRVSAGLLLQALSLSGPAHMDVVSDSS